MIETSLPVKLFLRTIVVAYLFLLVLWPVYMVADETFADGFTAIEGMFGDANVVHAMQVTGILTVWAVAINLVFGVTLSILLVRYRFPGKRVLSALADIPLSVSPVVVGLCLTLVYNSRDGWFGAGLAKAGAQIIFSTPGMVMATAFVALPLVIREVVPVLEEIGDEQEWAARSLGASPVQTFLRITLPNIKWAVIYGVVLATARSLGEYGAVKVVSGNIIGETQSLTLIVEERYQNFDKPTAYASAFLLAFVAVACIVVVATLRPKHSKVR